MIICIHMPYYGKIYFEPLTRFAVPVFFMITGYFYSSVKQRNREYAQIKKTIKLFLYSSFLYFIWDLLKCILTNESIAAYLYSCLSLKAWIRFVCFNKPLLSEHLWYLAALIYVLVIVLAADKYSNREKLYKFLPFLLLLNIILGNYSTVIFGVRLPLMISRNYLFCGLPFFLLGDIICKKQSSFTQNQLLFFAVLSAIFTVAENAVLLNCGVLFNTDCFIATPFLAYSLFMLALRNRTVSSGSLWAKTAQLGKTAATIIYIIHPIAISIIGRAVAVVARYVPHLDIVWAHAAPIVIFVSCTIFACCFSAFKRKWNKHSRRRSVSSDE